MFKVNKNKLQSSLEVTKTNFNNLDTLALEITSKDENNTYTISFWTTTSCQTLLNFEFDKEVLMDSYIDLNDVEIGINNSYSLNGLDYGTIIFKRINVNTFQIKVEFKDYFDMETKQVYDFFVEELLVLK